MSSRRSATTARVPSRGPRRRAVLRQELGVCEDTARGLLVEAAAERQAALDAQTRLLVIASRWALLHLSTLEQGAVLPGREGAAQVAGDGAPLVAEFCLAELGAAIGMSTETARCLVGDAVELAHRLPATWTMLLSGQVAPWRARRIAARTAHLCAAAAAHVDEVVHGVAEQIGLTAIEALVEEAHARFDPETAAAEAAEAAERRDVRIDLGATRRDGLTEVQGLVDAADAVDFEALVAQVAHDLLTIHPEEPLAVRRALALGYIGRRQHPPAPGESAAEPAAGLSPGARPREVVLYLHLHESATRGAGGLARMENGRLLVDADRVRDWLDVQDARVTITPVLDLAKELHTEAYEIPDRLREQTVLRDLTCVFPWCRRAARGCEIDHITPWLQGGKTTSENLAALCRRHHRHKTHGGWRYQRTGPTAYLWTSPHGLRLLRDHRGTRLLE